MRKHPSGARALICAHVKTTKNRRRRFYCAKPPIAEFFFTAFVLGGREKRIFYKKLSNQSAVESET